MIRMLRNSIAAEHQELQDKIELVSKVAYADVHYDLMREKFKESKMILDQVDNIIAELDARIEELEVDKDEAIHNGAYFNHDNELKFLKNLRG